MKSQVDPHFSNAYYSLYGRKVSDARCNQRGVILEIPLGCYARADQLIDLFFQ